MARTQDKPVTGRLDLIDYFHETASTHVDTTRRASLEPHGRTGVLLKTYYEHNHALQPSGPPTDGKWVIDRDALIKLIREHGQFVG